MSSWNFTLNDIVDQKLTFVDDVEKPSWTLDQALNLIRLLQPTAFEAGYHLNLGGGVLNHGKSNNDLDILAMPGSFEVDTNIEKLVRRLVTYHNFSLDEIKTNYNGIIVHKLSRNTSVSNSSLVTPQKLDLIQVLI